MNDHYTRHLPKPLWAALRYPGTGWGSEMLARQLNRTLAHERAGGHPPERPVRGRRNPVKIEVRSFSARRPREVCCAAGG